MSIKYTEELQNSMNNSNNEFKQEEYTLEHAKNAAKLSLYYAHGNTEKNEISLRTSKIDEKRALKLDKKSVLGINLANNALTAANQSLVDSGKATSNISTAAANMQIAANAITKLSSDVAGILAVANAADHGSQIQDSVERANDKTKKAAKLAEEVSLVSMSATIEAAQATASTVVTDAQEAVASMTNFEKATAAQYSTTSDQVVAGNESLTDAQKVEKAASGAYDIAKKQNKAIKSTRKLINKVSNFDLEVYDPALPKNVLKVIESNNGHAVNPAFKVDPGKSYTISFKKLPGDGLSASLKGKEISVDDGDYIQYYRLIMVKYDASEAFDINVARDLDVGTYYQFEPKGYRGYSRTFYLLGTDQALIPEGGPLELDPISLESIESEHVRGIAVDYMGKPIEAGECYVAYVYAVYTEAYQKLINNTDGFLSLPSKYIQLQLDLPKIPGRSLRPGKGKEPNLTLYPPVDLNSRDMAASFQVYQKDYDPETMEYRVMLVEKKNVDAKDLNNLVALALENLDAKEYIYNIENQKLHGMINQLNELEVKFNTIQTQLDELGAQRAALQKEISEYQKDKVPQYLTGELIEVESQIKPLEKKLEANTLEQQGLEQLIYGSDNNPGGLQQVVAKAYDAFQEALQLDEKLGKKKIEEHVSDFIFDTDLMSKVTRANYYPATPFKWDSEDVTAMVNIANEEQTLAATQAINIIEDYLTYDIRLKLAENAVKEAEEDFMKATTAFNVAERKLDNALYAEVTSTPKSKLKPISGSPKGSKKGPKAETKAQLIAELKMAKKAMDNSQIVLSSKEVALDVIKANKDEKEVTKVENALDKYVSAACSVERANRLAEIEKDLSSQNPATVGEEVVYFYTELGEDATDNYGEPLQFNDISEWKSTFDIFQELWVKGSEEVEKILGLSGDLEKAILAEIENVQASIEKDQDEVKALKAAVKKAALAILVDPKHNFDKIWKVIIPDKLEIAKLTAEIKAVQLAESYVLALVEGLLDKIIAEILEVVDKLYLDQKTAKHELSYEAVVLTTTTSDDQDEVDQYRLKHSDYSKAEALWGVVE